MLINEFTQEELEKIRIYLERSDQLQKHVFFEKGVKLKHKLELEGNNLKISNRFPDQSAFNDFLLRFRIFVLNDSRCNFGGICNLLKKVLYGKADHKELYDWITAIQDDFNNIMNGKTDVKILPDLGKPKELIDNFLNAKYFHDDTELLKELQSDKLTKIVSEWGFQYYVFELSRRIVALKPYVMKTLES